MYVQLLVADHSLSAHEGLSVFMLCNIWLGQGIESTDPCLFLSNKQTRGVFISDLEAHSYAVCSSTLYETVI